MSRLFVGIAVYLVIVNCVGFAAMGKDNSKAKRVACIITEKKLI